MPARRARVRKRATTTRNKTRGVIRDGFALKRVHKVRSNTRVSVLEDEREHLAVNWPALLLGRSLARFTRDSRAISCEKFLARSSRKKTFNTEAKTQTLFGRLPRTSSSCDPGTRSITNSDSKIRARRKVAFVRGHVSNRRITRVPARQDHVRQPFDNLIAKLDERRRPPLGHQVANGRRDDDRVERVRPSRHSDDTKRLRPESEP